MASSFKIISTKMSNVKLSFVPPDDRITEYELFQVDWDKCQFFHWIRQHDSKWYLHSITRIRNGVKEVLLMKNKRSVPQSSMVATSTVKDL